MLPIHPQNDLILGGVEVLRADRQPCPVCGHPTGDCTGESGGPRHVLGPGAYVSMPHEETYLVEEDVYQETRLNEFTVRRIKVAVAGTAIPMSRARVLGLVD